MYNNFAFADLFGFFMAWIMWNLEHVVSSDPVIDHSFGLQSRYCVMICFYVCCSPVFWLYIHTYQWYDIMTNQIMLTIQFRNVFEHVNAINASRRNQFEFTSESISDSLCIFFCCWSIRKKTSLNSVWMIQFKWWYFLWL